MDWAIYGEGAIAPAFATTSTMQPYGLQMLHYYHGTELQRCITAEVEWYQLENLEICGSLYVVYYCDR
jgi:hypothetical protein